MPVCAASEAFLLSNCQVNWKNGIFRSIWAHLEQTVHCTHMWICKFLEYSDEITLPFTLEELRLVRNDPKSEARMLERCKELEEDKYECQPFSGKYLDKNRVPVLFYLGDWIKGDRPLQYTLTDDPAKKFCMQLQNRGERHLCYAWNHGEEIVTDGIQVSSLSPLF